MRGCRVGLRLWLTRPTVDRNPYVFMAVVGDGLCAVPFPFGQDGEPPCSGAGWSLRNRFSTMR